MFLTSRTEFKDYLSNTKKPFMAIFINYKEKNNFLIDVIIIQLVANGVLTKKIEKKYQKR